MPAKATDETIRARRAVGRALVDLAKVHGDDTVRAAVNRWLMGERQRRAAVARLKEAAKELRELRAIARGRRR
jgi:3-methyladenine DNA glycosylase AlkD